MSEDSPINADPFDESALWELALRLVPVRYGPSGPSTEPPRIWPGQLPDLPFEVPVPDRGRIVGSYGRGQHLTVLIDTDAVPKEFVAFYQERMLASGWSTPPWLQGRGGFVSPDVAQQAQTVFCRSAEGPGITVSAEAGSDRTTHGTLTVILDPADNPCRPPADHGYHAMRAGPHIPPLEAPADCALVGYGTSGGPGTSTALATLTSDLDLAAVAEHYTQQLEEAGWHLEAKGQGGPAAWSTWTFVDRDRSTAHGILTVVREPGEAASYALSLQARGNEPNVPPGGE